MVIIDQYYYKRLVIVPLNIVLYNVFGGDVGPDIFGTEPWWFYILNGLLNFNVLFLAALASLPVLVCQRRQSLMFKRKEQTIANALLTRFHLSCEHSY